MKRFDGSVGTLLVCCLERWLPLVFGGPHCPPCAAIPRTDRPCPPSTLVERGPGQRAQRAHTTGIVVWSPDETNAGHSEGTRSGTTPIPPASWPTRPHADAGECAANLS